MVALKQMQCSFVGEYPLQQLVNGFWRPCGHPIVLAELQGLSSESQPWWWVGMASKQQGIELTAKARV
ncbi:hypothetical protein CCR91_01865 [Thiorhodovibrio winogradskyi]|nr:hypothetical protein [Thiorhodovibrio winogradskyi]